MMQPDDLFLSLTHDRGKDALPGSELRHTPNNNGPVFSWRNR